MKKYYLFIPFLAFLLASCSSEVPEYIEIVYKELPEQIDFNYHVRPILSDRCFSCHGPDEKSRKAGLRLDTEEEAFAGLENGNGYALVSKKPFESEVVKRILSTDPDLVMPTPESKISLNDKEKAIIIKWLEQGAEWKDHWSFIPPEKAELPTVKNKELSQNPIDYFVLRKLEKQGLSFSEKADKATLIRRVYLDIIGLPPSLEEVDKYIKDESSDAFEKVVDGLLASQNFGERWAWDWLDASRYSDTNGFQNDPERKMWPWREWVINAFNTNMPYDQFTIEQLAGDLLPNSTTNQTLATAFNRNHTNNGEGGRIPEETRVENVFDRLETTGTVWLGLTLNCTRCHDHKFDPITQEEYFKFFDYFNQTSETGKLKNSGHIPPILDLSSELEKDKVVQLQVYLDKISETVEKHERIIYPSETGNPADSPAAADLDGQSLNELKFTPTERSDFYVDLASKIVKKSYPKYSVLLADLSLALKKKNKQNQKNLQVMVMDEIEEPRPTFILNRGVYDRPLGQVKNGVPKALPSLPDDSPKNRLGLAKWLVSNDHPLTARVTVNRFWQSIFGTGIVKTADDFGVQGSLPTHPELLDWLAVDFMENKWDVKALLKQIVLSRTYQQSSKISAELLKLDPENKLLARAPRYRLPSWMIRDQALTISGLLKNAIGGPSVRPYQPDGIWVDATFGKKKYVQDSGDGLYRRTLYTYWRRVVGPTMLFDNASRLVCSVKPLLTNSPQHALITLNDITYLEAARVMAEKVLDFGETVDEQIAHAFRSATFRMPRPEEKKVLNQQLNQFRQEFKTQTSSIDKFLPVGEYPVNKQLDQLEYASFTALCSMILNLDETITKQ